MRKIYLTIGCVATALLASAQLPNPGFADWGECVPWTSTDNTKAQGTQPAGWTISNVIGINGVGATTVGAQAEGIDGASAVTVKNSPNSLLATQTVPGYFTLGTTWSTSVMGSQNDGGTFGGIKSTTRPDGVYFSYKRSVADGSQQTATVVAYIWTGTFTQKDVPGNIVMAGNPVAVDMVNRDRNILGMETAKGGEVTKTDGAALIAKAVRPIAPVSHDWTELTVPFEYESEATPEMLNVIFAANDYFDSEKIDQGNTFTVAAPRLVYWSKLSGITIGGTALAGFEDSKYDYEVEALPALSDVQVAVFGAAAKAAIEEKDGKIVITVTNPEGTDEEGLSEHVYTISVKEAPVPAGPAVDYKGKLVVTLAGSEISSEGGDDATISIIPNTDGTSTVLLPNLSLGDLGELGEIKVDGVATETIDGVTTYNATVTNFPVMGGAIVADKVEVNGTTIDGKANMTINVTWQGMPIECTFKGDKVAGINGIESDNANRPVQFFDMQGRRVADPSTPGLYIRRQGTESVKVLVR